VRFPRWGIVVALVASGCAGAQPSYETISLLGDTLYTPVLAETVAARYDSLLTIARVAHEHTPENLDSIIWFGRRTAYLGHFREAVSIYTEGLALHPGEPRLLRHRGHRYITLRKFDKAIADLGRAAELMVLQPDRVEEDGLPNEQGVPTSTLYTNVWYHLGLAHYLRGDLGAARDAYESGLAASDNPDMATAMRYWLAIIDKRTGNETGLSATLAAVDPGFDIIENRSYHRLLLFFRGDLPRDSMIQNDGVGSLEDVTTAYGVAAWQLATGEGEEATRIFGRLLAARDQWPAFAYIAAEAETARALSNDSPGG